MRRRTIIKSLVLLGLGGCNRGPQSDDGQQPSAEAGESPGDAVLKKSIGIATAGGKFTPLVKAGQRLPYTFSDTFTNKTDGGPAVTVALSQKDESGMETITSINVAIPPVADNSLRITVTLKISHDKKMRVKTTVAETASVSEFGPFPVE